MLEALTAAIVAARPIHSPEPRRRMRANNAAAASASTAPASVATPPSPRHRQVAANTTSASHSQANHGWRGRLKENGSATGARPVAKTSSPVRMCQPVSPSASSDLKPRGWANADSNRAAKNTSSSDGVSQRRNGPRGASGGTLGDMESSYTDRPAGAILEVTGELAYWN